MEPHPAHMEPQREERCDPTPLPPVPSEAREDKERATTLQILRLAGDSTGGSTPVPFSVSSGSEESPAQSRSTAEMSEWVL